MTTEESFPSNNRVAVKGALEGVREAVTELRKTLHKWAARHQDDKVHIVERGQP